MQRANQEQEERAQGSQRSRQEPVQLQSSRSTVDRGNVFVYPLHPHDGYLVLPAPESQLNSAASTNDRAEERVNMEARQADLPRVLQRAGALLASNPTWLTGLGSSLRPTTHGRILPSGRIMYVIPEQNAVLTLPATRFFEAFQSEGRDTTLGEAGANQSAQDNSSHEQIVQNLREIVVRQLHANYRQHPLNLHSGYLVLGRLNNIPVDSPTDVAEQIGDLAYQIIPHNPVCYNLLNRRGRLYISRRNNSTLSPQSSSGSQNQAENSERSQHSGPHHGSPHVPRHPRTLPQIQPSSSRVPSPQPPPPPPAQPPSHISSSSEDEEYMENETGEQNITSGESRIERLLRDRELASRYRRQRVRQRQGHERPRRRLPMPFIHYPLKRRKHFKK